jgi:hypothetical protein
MLNSYKELNEYLAKGKNKDNRPLENNTRVIRINEMSIGIKLHETFVLIYTDHEMLEIDTGGWQTNTTKDRMNKYQNVFRIYTKNHIWYMGFVNFHSEISFKEYLYKDGIVIDLQKKTILPYMGAYTELQPIEPIKEKKQLQLKKKIDNYCNEFAKEFVHHKIDNPTAGDCWYCSMLNPMADSDHLLSHIQEKYYVPSLLNNALKQFERKLSLSDKHNIACIWNNPDNEHQPYALGLTEKRIRTVLKSYMHKELGLGFGF